MALNEMLLQNYSYMIDSDDEEVWSLGDKRCSNRSRSTSSESGFMLSVGRDPRDCKPDFRLFQDYFGLSNLLNNVQISEDNPLLHNNQRNLAVLQRRNRRSSWSSDASDSAAVLSPTIDGNQSEVGFDGHIPVSNQDLAMKQFPPPSMRLSKEMREHIISGAYQLQIANRITDKVIPPPPPPPPVLSSSPPRAPLQTSVIPNMPNTVRQQQPGHQVCVFCRNNGESESVFSSHVLKDNDGRTSCPILRAYTCPICKANGDNSHTIKYCPMNQSTRNSVVPTQPSNLCFQQRNQPLPMPRLPPPFGSSFPNIPLPPLPISPVGLTLGPTQWQLFEK